VTVGDTTDGGLRDRRLELVRRHMEAENALDFGTALATFVHPHYELMPSGKVYDGPEEVARYYRSSRAAFPDQRNEAVVLTAGDDVVVAEFDLLGTHLGPLRGAEASGRSFRSRMCALFLFEPGGDRIVCERVYYDQAGITAQLAGGSDDG
jgi:steroid delta-isomerase-like uncharacterized protein